MQSELTKQRNREETAGNGETADDESATSTPRTAASADPTVRSQMDRQANFEDAANQISNKLAKEPGNLTKEEGDLMHRREQRAFGTTEKGGLASQVQHQVAENEGATTRRSSAPTLDPNTQSQADRQANYEDAAAKVGGKLADEPGSVTKEEADTMHGREQRAFGHTEKGGLASQAQHQVAESQKP